MTIIGRGAPRPPVRMSEKKTYVCAECYSEDVLSLNWLQTNTGQIVEDPTSDVESHWCKNCRCHQQIIPKPKSRVPIPPEAPLTPEAFANYIWEIRRILNDDPPNSKLGEGSPPKNEEVALLDTFASFFSCAAEDGLWQLHDGESVALDDEGGQMDTPWGLMGNLRDRARRYLMAKKPKTNRKGEYV